MLTTREEMSVWAGNEERYKISPVNRNKTCLALQVTEGSRLSKNERNWSRKGRLARV